MSILAVDVGGSHAACALVSGTHILACKTISASGADNLEIVVSALTGAMQQLLVGCPESDRCRGIGFSFCGIVDSRRCQILSSNEKYSDSAAFDLVSWAQTEFNLPVRLENDARTALLGEWYAGAGRGSNDIVMLTLGTGVGGAAMIDGKLLRGKHFQAGCLGGHIPVLFTGRKCNCGGIGCAEAEAAGWSLPLVVKDWPGISQSALSKYPHVGFKELFEEAGRGDSVAVGVRDRCLNIWAADAVGLIHAYDPEIIVMGGGVMQSASLIIPYMESYVRQYSWTPWGDVQVRVAELGNNAALLGAVPLLS